MIVRYRSGRLKLWLICLRLKFENLPEHRFDCLSLLLCRGIRHINYIRTVEAPQSHPHHTYTAVYWPWFGHLIWIAREQSLFKLLGSRKSCAVHRNAHHSLDLLEMPVCFDERTSLIDQVLWQTTVARSQIPCRSRECLQASTITLLNVLLIVLRQLHNRAARIKN